MRDCGVRWAPGGPQARLGGAMQLASVTAIVLAASAVNGRSPEIHGTTTHETMTYYDVVGRTPEQLREAMNLAGPIGPEGGRIDALASWRVRYTYQTRSGGDGCRVTTLKVTADISSTLPRWIDKPRTESLVTERWEKHIAALTASLEPIREIGRRAASALHEKLWNLPHQASCQDLEDAIGKAADALIQDHLRQTDEYNKSSREHPSEALRFP
jgi:predicted secreted Zn-dependent protease